MRRRSSAPPNLSSRSAELLYPVTGYLLSPMIGAAVSLWSVPVISKMLRLRRVGL